MSENGSDLGAFLAGFVIGGLVGAAAAIILAPQSGVETRTQIANRSNEWMSSGNEQWQSLRNRAGSSTESLVSQLDKAGGRVQEQARIVLDKGRNRVADARSTAPESNLEEDAAPAESDES